MVFYLGEKIKKTLSKTKSMIISSVFIIFYIITCLVPVSCNGDIKGACNRGSSGTFFIIGCILGGCAVSILWTMKDEYLRRCGDAESVTKCYNMFYIMMGAGAVISSIFSLSLLVNAKMRTGLYAIFLVLAIGAFILQLCTLVKDHSYS